MSSNGLNSQFALALAVGPVGGFIAGGRRSRDLWFGSRLVSELNRRAAEKLMELKPDTEWIIPTAARLRQPIWTDSQDFPHGATLGNKLNAFVWVEGEDLVMPFMAEVRYSVYQYLAGEIQRLLDSAWLPRLRVDRGHLVEQMKAIAAGDFAEVYAAWAPVINGDRERALKRARHLLGATKSCRGFVHPNWSQPGKPKSTLDPGWDSVLIAFDVQDRSRESAAARIDRQILGVRPMERLAALDLLRRRSIFEEVEPEVKQWEKAHEKGQGVEVTQGEETGSPKPHLPGLPFPPLARIAADAWLEGLAKTHAQLLARISQCFETLNQTQRKLFYLLTSPCRECCPEKPLFPFDPSLLFENALQAKKRELRLSDQYQPHYLKKARAPLSKLAAMIRELHHTNGVPQPYYALIEADGDGIGHLFGELSIPDQKELSRRLDNFADQAGILCEREHGCPFYVGGDELAAYLPVDKLSTFLRGLSRLFHQFIVEPEGLSWPAGRPPSLSVGAVLAHTKYELRAVRRWAHEALDTAKAARKTATPHEDNFKGGWLCLLESPRGGALRSCCAPLDDLLFRLNHWQTWLLGEERSLSLVQGLLAWRQQFHETGEPDNGGRSHQGGLKLAKASLLQKAERSGQIPDQTLLKSLLQAESWDHVHQLSQELLIAWTMAQVAQQRQPKTQSSEVLLGT